MRIRRGGWVYRLMRHLHERALQSEKDRVILDAALGHAYEGLVITDAEGVIRKVNRAYATFLGLEIEQMDGKHCTQVVENTRMHIVAKTGVPELAQVQKIRGHDMICHRI